MLLEIDEREARRPRVSPQRKKAQASAQKEGSPTKSRSKTVQEEPDEPFSSPEPSEEATFEILESTETIEFTEALQAIRIALCCLPDTPLVATTL